MTEDRQIFRLIQNRRVQFRSNRARNRIKCPELGLGRGTRRFIGHKSSQRAQRGTGQAVNKVGKVNSVPLSADGNWIKCPQPGLVLPLEAGLWRTGRSRKCLVKVSRLTSLRDADTLIRWPGGVAVLNARLQAANPSGSVKARAIQRASVGAGAKPPAVALARP